MKLFGHWQLWQKKEGRPGRKWGRFTVRIGKRCYTMSSGPVPPAPVRFWGRRLGQYEEYVRTCVRRTMTLYWLADGRLLLHTLEDDHSKTEVHAWIEFVEPADIDVGGKYENVGWAAGLTRPLSVGEGVEMSASPRERQDEPAD